MEDRREGGAGGGKGGAGEREREREWVVTLHELFVFYVQSTYTELIAGLILCCFVTYGL